MQRVSKVKVSELTGVPLGTLNSLQRNGFIPSAGGLTVAQVLALAVSRGLMSKGLTMQDSMRVLTFLWDRSREAIEADFAEGRKYLALVGGGQKLLLPKMLTLESIETSPIVRGLVEFDEKFRPTLVDVQRVWDRILKALAKETANV